MPSCRCPWRTCRGFESTCRANPGSLNCVFSMQMLENGKTEGKQVTGQARYHPMADKLNSLFFQKEPTIYTRKDWKHIKTNGNNLRRDMKLLLTQLRERMNISKVSTSLSSACNLVTCGQCPQHFLCRVWCKLNRISCSISI